MNATAPETPAVFDRVPPHSITDERAALGAMIVAGYENLHVIGEVAQVLRPDDFFLPRHAALYRGILGCYERKSASDLQLMRGMLGPDSDAVNIDYMVELAEETPISLNAIHYARNVRDKAVRRRMLDAAGRIAERCHAAEDVADLLEESERMVYSVREGFSETKPEENLGAILDRTMVEMEAAEAGMPPGVATGFHALDAMLGGLRAGEMTIIAARPSIGKTSLATGIMRNMAGRGVPVALFSMETPRDRIGMKFLAAECAVSTPDMERMKISESDRTRIDASARRLSQLPIVINDSQAFTAPQLLGCARRYASKHGTGVFFIDYLQLIDGPKRENRQVEVAAISRRMKAMAMELKVPVVVLAQLNRNAEMRADKKPMLADLRESGAIEQDADVVILLHREDFYHRGEDGYQPTGLATLDIAKHRNGETGIVRLRFNAPYARFEDHYE